MSNSALDTEQSPKMAPTTAENQAISSKKSFMCKIPLYPQTTERLFGPLVKQPLIMKTDMCEIILNPSNPGSKRRVSRKEEPVNCAYCGSRFLRRKYLKCHLQLKRCKYYDPTAVTHVTDSDSTAGKRVTDSDSTAGKRVTDSDSTAGKCVTDSSTQEPIRKNAICLQCGAVFLKKKYLDQHLRKKRCKIMKYFKGKRKTEKRYHCTVCGKGFTYRQNFYRHQNLCQKSPSVQENASKIVSEVIKDRLLNLNDKQISQSEIIERRKELETENLEGLNNKKTLNDLVCEPISLSEISNKETNLESKKKTRYHCSVCRKGFIYRKAFEKHQNLPCSVCYKKSKDQIISGEVSTPAKIEVSSVECGRAVHCETENFVESANSPVTNGDCEPASFGVSREKEADIETENMSWHCSVCEEGFYDQKNLERHQSVSGSLCYKPSEVEEPARRVYALDQNKTLNINHKRSFVSKASEKEVLEFALWVSRLHQKESSKGKTYRCFVCKMGYIYKNNLFRHIKRSKCKSMYLNVISPETLNDEFRDMTLEMERERGLPLTQTQKIPNPIAKKKPFCPSCLRVFSTKSNLHKHCRMRRCKLEVNVKTLKQFQVMHKMRVITKVSERPTKVNCQDCGVLFRKRKYLIQHQKLKRCKRRNILAVQAQGVSPKNNNGEAVNDVSEIESYQIETLLDQGNDESDNLNSSCTLDPNPECDTWSVAEDIVKEEIEEMPTPTTHEQIEFTQEQIELMVNVKEETDEFLENQEDSQIQSIESGFPVEVIEEETGEVLWPPLLEQSHGTKSVPVAGIAEKQYDDVCEEDDVLTETQDVKGLDMSYCDTSPQIHEDTAQDEKNYDSYRLQECDLSGQEWARAVLSYNKKGNRSKRRRQHKCYHCGQSFVSISNLNKHFRMNRCRPHRQSWKGSRWMDPVGCRDCGTQYLRFKYFLQHKKLNRCNKLRRKKHCLAPGKTEGTSGKVWDLISSGEIHVEKSNELSCKSNGSTDKQLEPDSSNTHPQNSNGVLLERPLGMKDRVTTGIINISLDEGRNEEPEGCEYINEDEAEEAIAPNPSGKSNEPHHSQVDVGGKLIHTEENLNPSHHGQEVTSLLRTFISQTLEPENYKSQVCETDVETSLARKPKEVRCQRTGLKGSKNQMYKPSQPDHVKINPIGSESPELSAMPETGNAVDSFSFDVSKQIKSSLKNSFHGNAGRHRLPLNCRRCGKHFFSKSNLNRHYRLVKCQMVLRHVRIKGHALFKTQGKVRADETVTCADCGAPFRKKKYMITHKKLKRCKMHLKHESMKKNSLTLGLTSTIENTPNIDLSDVANQKSSARKNDTKHKASRKGSIQLQEGKYLAGLERRDVHGSVPINQDPPEGLVRKRSNPHIDDFELDNGIDIPFKTKPNSKSQKNKKFEVYPDVNEENYFYNQQNFLYQNTSPNERVTCADCGAPFLKKKYLIVHKKLNRCRMSVSRVDENRSLPVVPGCSNKNSSSSSYISDESFQHFLARNSLQDIPLQIWSQEEKLGILRERPYECQNCSRGFFYKKNLYRHVRLGRCKSAKKCPFCGVYFFHKKTMAEHIKYELQNIQNPLNSQNGIGNELTDQNCWETLSYRKENRNHSRKESSLPLIRVPDLENARTCVDSENQNVNIWVAEDINMSLDETQISTINLICPVCRKCFSSQCELKLHMKEHSSVKKLECSVCNAKFYDKFVLDCHTNIRHSDRDCLCKMCNKDLKGYKDLDLFLPEYENSKPYECPLCVKKFSRYRSLLRHVKIHLRKCSKKDNMTSKF